ncbi:M48 family metalloprotease [Haloimpatiens massiliensis]|uniref:M48 family metalloprotease n=1 Tax=Haloimpatiens massiliensis TaxID=1658110 RepID=UPI000C82009A|nr:M48 family metalloprotease [Haloimpatiens massiliensis]
MRDIFLLIGIIIFIMMLGITWDKVTSFAMLKRFNRYDLCDEWINEFVEEVKQKLGITNNVLVSINRKAKNPNADVAVYKNDVLIVLHGQWSENNIKFVIGHELAHIKLKHREVTNNMLFITCIFMITILASKVFVYSIDYEIISKFKGVIEAVLLVIIVIIFNVWYTLHRRNFNKANWQREYAADLVATNLVGLDFAIDAIGLLKNDKTTKYKYSHPSNDDRIQYLIKNHKHNKDEKFIY